MPREFMVAPANPAEPYRTTKTIQEEQITIASASQRMESDPMTAQGAGFDGVVDCAEPRASESIRARRRAHARLPDPGRTQAISIATDLEMRLRQTKPDVILLDLATDLDTGLRAHPLRVLA